MATVYNDRVAVLRTRKGVPGIGRKIARHFNAYEVTCGHRPARKIPPNALIINYGRSQWPIWYEEAMARGVRILNAPSAVALCVNKLSTLRVLSTQGVKCIPYTEDVQEAMDWVGAYPEYSSDMIAGIARSTLIGKQGKGIIPFYHATEYGIEGDIFPRAKLYTKFYDKTHEFRVHVVNNQVIDLVQKKKMGKKKRAQRKLDGVDHLVRNHKRGWVFAHNDLICDTGGGREYIETLALDACRALNIDFAGVDILAKYNGHGLFKDAVICEVNSAPGMSSPTTFNRYVQAFEALL